jgi:Arc/MetJ-type ribon-helix-helix transcriptional regulator
MFMRMSEEHAAALQWLVGEGRYESVQEAVAEAVTRLLESEAGPDWASVAKPREEGIDASSLMGADGAAGMDEAVRKAVSEYFRSRMGPVV